MINRFLLILFFSLILCCLFGEADSLASTTESANQFETPNFGIMAFKLIFSLLFIIILIYSTLYFLKKTIYKNRFVTNEKSGKVLASFSLNSKQTIYIVLILNKLYILASTPEDVKIIDQITDQETINQHLSELDSNESAAFANIFKKFIKNEN